VKGFSRTELLICIAVVVLLGLLGVFILAKRADRPRQLVCQSNMKELAAGFVRQVQDSGTFPWSARREFPNASDWIHWQSDRVLTNSVLAPYVQELGSRVLQCPGDAQLRYRDYPFSYSMNAHLEKLKVADIENLPSLILLYEEASPNDGACAPGERADALTQRHVDKSSVAFADGHTEFMGEKNAAMNKHTQPIVKPEPKVVVPPPMPAP